MNFFFWIKMAETLGTLCDKLTIVNLKKWHCDSDQKMKSLDVQTIELKKEIDLYVKDAFAGELSSSILFKSNKVFKKEGNETREFSGSLAELFSSLLEVNLELWRTQDKVYDFKKVPVDEKDKVINKLAILNLERNNCMELIDRELQKAINKTNIN